MAQLGKKVAEWEAPEDRTGRAERISGTNEEILAGIIVSITDHMSMIDENHNIVWANEVARELFGPDLVGKKCYRAYHGYDNPCEPCVARRCFEDGKVHDQETEVIRADGRQMVFWCVAGVAARHEDGRPRLVVEISRNITVRKQAEKALRESEARYRAVVEDQTEFICRFLPDGTLTFVNEAYCRYFGKRREELIGHDFLLLIPEEDREGVKNQISSLSPKNPVAMYEHRVIVPDGIHWQQWNDRAILDEQGRIVEFQSVGRDITERMEAEQRIRDYQKQLESLAMELSLAEERERRRIATDIHDDIGQALITAKLKLEMLQQSVSSTRTAARLNEITALLHQVIERVRSLTFELSPPILYYSGFEDAVEWLCERMQQEHGVRFEFTGDGQHIPMNEDARILLFKVVRELLTNIARHAQAQKARVSITRDGDNVQIHVHDNGIGFDASHVNSYPAGTPGFGLFSIRERLRHLGGHLEINSTTGKGTRVTVIVPATCRK
ncbi:MAG: PAS domain S-box protein [Thermodesulfobacteriota bacterium]|nr:PAS domain S-box protein [Thermodesulfobacteriota bacterium]